MKVLADYHTHTNFSHGKGTIEDNVMAARDQGLEEVAITDHGPRSFRIGINGMKSLKKMKQTINHLNDRYNDIKVLLGMEANVVSLDGYLDIDNNFLEYLDILNVGLHPMVYPKSFRDFKELFLINWWHRIAPGNDKKQKLAEIRKRNTNAILKALDNYPVFIVTHPGLHMDIDTFELANKCSKQGAKLEINCSHASKLTDYVKTAVKANNNIEFVISSDAHEPCEVGKLEKGVNLCKQVGISTERIVNIT
ncbi:PHP domain-containing protein [Natranaerobius trueperi]|uniref:Histidinol-phosphatase n=1 Tax=Natranaerobius trueperi TaxID=759412 RepID=A0A226BY00_9FIRM|nr:PHP domain-containing protein [Natranaerobius trueperi]OWZ83801.1 histidinol-phosphatase [Natranaerobius trueperi]